MKTFRFFLVFVLVSAGLTVISQNSILPDVDVYTLEESRISARDISMNNQTVVLVFWNSDGRESLDQVRMVNEESVTELKRENVKIVGICTDCAGTMGKIRPFVYGNCLDFEVYIDKNNDLKRAMNVPYVPYTIIIDPVMDVYRYFGFIADLDEFITNAIDNSQVKMTGSK